MCVCVLNTRTHYIPCPFMYTSTHTIKTQVATGGHSDRRILELAAQQSMRESQQRAEVESCKVSIRKLQEALANKVGMW